MMAIAAQGKKERAEEELLERQKDMDEMQFCDNPECLSVSNMSRQQTSVNMLLQKL
jgi:hypothetical protein